MCVTLGFLFHRTFHINLTPLSSEEIKNDVVPFGVRLNLFSSMELGEPEQNLMEINTDVARDIVREQKIVMGRRRLIQERANICIRKGAIARHPIAAGLLLGGAVGALAVSGAYMAGFLGDDNGNP